MPRFSAFLLVILSLWLAGPAHAQRKKEKATAPSVEKPRKLSRKERKELARRSALEAAGSARPDLTPKERELSESYFMDGVRFLLLEDYTKALERLLKAYALNPTNAAVNYKIAETNLLSGNFQRRHQLRRAAVKFDPKNAYYYLLLAQIYSTQKQYPEATEVYNTLISQVPNSRYYLFNLADLYLAQGKFAEALATFDQAEKKFGTGGRNIVQEAADLPKQNKLDKALQEGESLIKANPDEARYVLAQAEIYATNSRFDRRHSGGPAGLAPGPRQPPGPT